MFNSNVKILYVDRDDLRSYNRNCRIDQLDLKYFNDEVEVESQKAEIVVFRDGDKRIVLKSKY